MRSIFDLSTEGLENLTDNQYVFTPNHSSYLDAFALAAVLDYERLKHSHWAGWAGIAFNNPWNTFIYKLARVVPIEAKQALHASLAYGAAVLRSGKNLIWFPEGDRTKDGELLPFKAGIGMLLDKYRVGVIPVCIKGTREALPPGAGWIKPGKIVVKFGSEVFAEDLLRIGEGKSDYEKIANGLRMRVQELKDRE
jgi:long-chain acyl-CoA synthetase